MRAAEQQVLEALRAAVAGRQKSVALETWEDAPDAEARMSRVLSGALSIPVGELKARLKELPRGRDIVAYCRGPYCVMAVEAVELLRKKGFKAHRMEQGVVDWRAHGWRVDSTGPSP